MLNNFGHLFLHFLRSAQNKFTVVRDSLNIKMKSLKFLVNFIENKIIKQSIFIFIHEIFTASRLNWDKMGNQIRLKLLNSLCVKWDKISTVNPP